MSLEWLDVTAVNIHEINVGLDLYKESFPEEVREPQQTFYDSMRKTEVATGQTYRFIVGKEEGKVVSLATGHYFSSINAGFIVYIVTDPHLRSKGIGAETLRALEERLHYDARQAGYHEIADILLETEHKDCVHTMLEKEECDKRALFFSRNGYSIMKDIVYVQPPLHQGEEIVPLHLYSKNVTTTVSDINAMIYEIYYQKYYRINGIDKATLNQCLQQMNIHRMIES